MFKRFTRPSHLLLALLLMLSQQPAPASAMPQPPLALALTRQSEPQPFTGIRQIKVQRQNHVYSVTRVNVNYADDDDFELVLTEPSSLGGMQIKTVNGATSAYFPSEKLVFDSFAFPLAGRTLLNLLSSRQELIGQNYELKLLNKDVLVNGKHTYLVEFSPKNLTLDKDNKTPLALTPRRRCWLDQSSLQVMREERYWDWVNADRSWNLNPDPYFVSAYDSYTPSARPVISPQQQLAGVRTLHLSGQSGRLSYPNAKEALTREGATIALPAYLPKGFMLVDIQLLNVSGLRVQLQNYTDGVNDLMVAVLPQLNSMQGFFSNGISFGLLDKLSTLSYQAPYNYFDASGENWMAEVFGDITPVELERVARSLKP